MAKRELLASRSDKRYIRRDEKGRFTSAQTDVGASLSTDRRRRAATTVSKGQGDRGDQRPSRNPPRPLQHGCKAGPPHA